MDSLEVPTYPLEAPTDPLDTPTGPPEAPDPLEAPKPLLIHLRLILIL